MMRSGSFRAAGDRFAFGLPSHEWPACPSGPTAVWSELVRGTGRVIVEKFGAQRPSPGGSRRRLAFRGPAEPFAIAGAPLARNAALVESGLDRRLRPQARIGRPHVAQLGSRTRRNLVQGNLASRF